MTRFDRHDPAVDQPAGVLLADRVGGLDNAVERAVGGENEPPVGGGVFRPHRCDQNCRLRSLSLRQQVPQGFGGEQRRVAEQHQQTLDLAIWLRAAREGGEPDAHCVAGAKRRILHDALRRFDETGDGFHSRPDHDDRCRRPQRAQRAKQMRDHRPAGDRVHDLGYRDFIRVPLPAARMMAAKPDWLIDGGSIETAQHLPHCCAAAPLLQHTDCYIM